MSSGTLIKPVFGIEILKELQFNKVQYHFRLSSDTTFCSCSYVRSWWTHETLRVFIWVSMFSVLWVMFWEWLRRRSDWTRSWFNWTPECSLGNHDGVKVAYTISRSEGSGKKTNCKFNCEAWSNKQILKKNQKWLLGSCRQKQVSEGSSIWADALKKIALVRVNLDDKGKRESH